MNENNIADVDRALDIWRDIRAHADETDDAAAFLEADEELNRLLDIRFHLPHPRPAT